MRAARRSHIPAAMHDSDQAGGAVKRTEYVLGKTLQGILAFREVSTVCGEFLHHRGQRPAKGFLRLRKLSTANEHDLLCVPRLLVSRMLAEFELLSQFEIP